MDLLTVHVFNDACGQLLRSYASPASADQVLGRHNSEDAPGGAPHRKMALRNGNMKGTPLWRAPSPLF